MMMVVAMVTVSRSHDRLMLRRSASLRQLNSAASAFWQTNEPVVDCSEPLGASSRLSGMASEFVT
jgi:hypothetical protein